MEENQEIALERGDEHLYLTEEELHIVSKYVRRLKVATIMGAEDAQGMDEARHIMFFSNKLAKVRKKFGDIVGIKKGEQDGE